MVKTIAFKLNSSTFNANSNNYNYNNKPQKINTANKTSQYDQINYSYNNEIYDLNLATSGNNISIFDHSNVDMSTAAVTAAYNNQQPQNNVPKIFDNNVKSAAGTSVPYDYSLTGTVVGSLVVSAAGKIIETAADSLLMAGGILGAKGRRLLAKAYDKAGKHDKAEQFRRDAELIEREFPDIIGTDYTSKVYDKYVNYTGIDEEVAYGKVHQYTTAAGTIVGYTALGIATGGFGTGALVFNGAVQAGGRAAEKAFQNGASFDEGMANYAAASVIGGASGWGMSALGAAAGGATSIPQVMGYTAAGAATTAAVPFAESLVEYATYGNNNYSSFKEYANATDLGKSMAMAGAIGGLMTGAQAVKGYTTFAKEMKEAGVKPSDANRMLKASKKEYIYGDEDHPTPKTSKPMLKKITKTDEYKELSKIAAKNGKTLKEYGNSNVSFSDQVKSLADVQTQKILADAAKAEPKISENIKKYETNSRKLTGYEKRLKEADSTFRKVGDQISQGKTPEVKDSIRYTYICKEDNMIDDVTQVVTGLKNDGYEVIPNGFRDTFYKQTGYKGINVNMRTPDGQVFEVQFHTQESFAAKEEYSHVFYEIMRSPEVTDPRANQLATYLNDVKAVENVHLEHVAKALPSGTFEGSK